jgi:DNA-binding transcriptional ArsR family regulator
VRQYQHPSEDEIALPKVLAALSDPVRLSIVSALAHRGECGWGGFDACVSNSTLSHHMKVLREAGIICNRGDGTRCIVSLRPELERAFPGLLTSILSFAETECPLRSENALLSGAESSAADSEAAAGRRARAPR